MKLIFIVLLYCCCYQLTFGQHDSTQRKYTPIKFLAIAGKTGYAQRLRFFEESTIAFRLKNSKTKYQGKIESIRDSSFFFTDANTLETQEIQLSNISKVYAGKRYIPFLTQGASQIALAGIVLTGIDVLNQVQRNTTVQVSPVLVGISIASIGIGILGNKLSSPSYRINQKHPLKIRFL